MTNEYEKMFHLFCCYTACLICFAKAKCVTNKFMTHWVEDVTLDFMC